MEKVKELRSRMDVEEGERDVGKLAKKTRQVKAPDRDVWRSQCSLWAGHCSVLMLFESLFL